MIPDWLHWLSIASLLLGGVCALVIAADLVRCPQNMWIMNIVWPVVATFGSVYAIYAYFRWGRLASRKLAEEASAKGEDPPNMTQTPFPVMVGRGASHCGAGCTLGDILAEWLAFFAPVVAAWFGWKTLFHEKVFAVWILDYIFAFALGVAFQYFTIKPMRGLSPLKGVVEAVKADAASLTAWQLGMYGFMAIAHFWIFGALLGAKLHVNTPEFWFMMQIAMIAGFATSYPVNWLLIRRGIKEKM